ncbi:hypothetical protein EVAR_8895_1 [Eumeta japonica]|uniref:Endonuclease/exonuclease/phosphatase domain-containing protein n=1 Tax=Eumeta variegata TaxID=151549 RepID=A0A4C1U088_EUMVA|nr:hypothetical protein EVAR_8895_1 [Eumeta japonica]
MLMKSLASDKTVIHSEVQVKLLASKKCKSEVDRTKLCISVEKRDIRLPSAISQQNVHYVLNNPALRMLLTFPVQVGLYIYKHLNGQLWETDSTTKAVIWSCDKFPFQNVVKNGIAGFVATSVDGICFYSCYAPSSLSIAEFTDFLDKLTEEAKKHYLVAIAGDFNSLAVDWGSKQTNARGKALLEAFTTLDVVLLNSGDTSAYIKGNASSTVDLTFVSSSLIKRNYDWKMMDIYTASDHNAILWEITNDQNT